MADGSAGGGSPRAKKLARILSTSKIPSVARVGQRRLKALGATIRSAGTGGMKTASRRAG